MPVYEYLCPKCHKRFEIWRSAEETKKQKCPTCNKFADKVFHPVGIIFKGSGFYTTDYCRKPGGEGKAVSSCGKAADKTCKSCGED